VGTDKRARQKANRAQKQQQQVRAETQRKWTRIALIVVGAIVGVVGLAWLAGNVIGDDDPETDPVTTATAGSVPDGAVPDGTASGGTASGGTAPTDTATTGTGPAVAECPPEGGADAATLQFAGPPPFCLDPDATYQAIVETNLGDFTIELDQERAPNTVNNFVFLARNLFYAESDCHRIIPDFVVQCGDPVGDPPGTGGPGYEFDDELPEAGEYRVGSVAMANSGPNTNGSQWFVITGADGEALPPDYSLFGQVGDGLDTTVAEMAALGSPDGTPTGPVEILAVSIIQS
jgi:cyclophilin family peptidyl-prolyl cis-trans isomerase